MSPRPMVPTMDVRRRVHRELAACQGQILVPVDDIATDSQIIHRVLVGRGGGRSVFGNLLVQETCEI